MRIRTRFALYVWLVLPSQYVQTAALLVFQHLTHSGPNSHRVSAGLLQQSPHWSLCFQPGHPPFSGEQQERLFRSITQTLSVLSLFQTSRLPLQGKSELSYYFSPDLLCSKHVSFFLSLKSIRQTSASGPLYLLFPLALTADTCSSTSF